MVKTRFCDDTKFDPDEIKNGGFYGCAILEVQVFKIVVFETKIQ